MPKQPEPLVSIIIPARNVAGYLPEAVRSVRLQNFREWELLAVDDGSTDGTGDVIQETAKDDPRIRCFRNLLSEGVSAARNRGLNAARGKWIAFLDGDDFLIEQALTERLTAATTNGGDGVFCPTLLVGPDSRILGPEITGPAILSFENMYQNPCHLNGLLVRRSRIGRVRFDARLTNGEDWLFIQHLTRQGLRFQRAQHARVAYRQHPDSAINQDLLAHELQLTHLLERAYSEDPDCLEPAPEHRFGLTSPRRSLVTLRRRLALGLRLALRGRTDELEIVAGAGLGSYWRVFPVAEIHAILKLAVIREFSVLESEWLTQYASVRKRFTDSIVKAFPYSLHRHWLVHYAGRNDTLFSRPYRYFTNRFRPQLPPHFDERGAFDFNWPTIT
jgi:glycosyltransferase involved in cell wall biosynthesis